jgi:hypothetical protein
LFIRVYRRHYQLFGTSSMYRFLTSISHNMYGLERV